VEHDTEGDWSVRRHVTPSRFSVGTIKIVLPNPSPLALTLFYRGTVGVQGTECWDIPRAQIRRD
jgi:hypothetical protein